MHLLKLEHHKLQKRISEASEESKQSEQVKQVQIPLQKKPMIAF